MTPHPYVTTLSQAKAYLGLSDTSMDAQIEVFLPVITDFLVGEYGNLNNDYLVRLTCKATSGSTTIEVVNPSAICVGDVLHSTVFADESEILSVDYVAGTAVISTAATADADTMMSFRVVPAGAKPTIAQMLLYKIKGNSVSGASGDMVDVKSKKYGPVSVTFAGAGEGGSISSHGYPTKLIMALRQYRRGRFV